MSILSCVYGLTSCLVLNFCLSGSSKGIKAPKGIGFKEPTGCGLLFIPLSASVVLGPLVLAKRTVPFSLGLPSTSIKPLSLSLTLSVCADCC